MSYWALKGISWLACLMSEAQTRWLARVLSFLPFYVFRYRRQVVSENLRLAFPEKSSREVLSIARQVYTHLTLTTLEFFRLPVYQRRGFDNVELLGMEHVTRAFEEGKGAMGITAHLGSFELCIAATQRAVPKIHVIVKSFPRGVERFVSELRLGAGLEILPDRNSLRTAKKALNDNAPVLLVIDQYALPRIGVTVDFFGQPASTMYAAALLAWRTQAAVLPAFAYRKADGTHVMEVEPPIAFEKQATREETLQHMTQLYTRAVEAAIRKYPEQWLWTHRRWKGFSSRSRKLESQLLRLGTEYRFFESYVVTVSIHGHAKVTPLFDARHTDMSSVGFFADEGIRASRPSLFDRLGQEECFVEFWKPKSSGDFHSGRYPELERGSPKLSRFLIRRANKTVNFEKPFTGVGRSKRVE